MDASESTGEMPAWSARAMSSGVRGHLKRIARLLLGVGLVVALVLYVDVDSFWGTLQTGDAFWLAVAAILVVPNVWLDVWSWGVVVRRLIERVSDRRLLQATLAGYAVGFFTPARVGEFAGRALMLGRGNPWDVSLTVFTQRMADMLVAVSVGFGAMVWARITSVIGAGWDVALTAGGIVMLVLTAGLIWPWAIDRIGRRLLPNASSIHQRTALLDRLHRRTRSRLVLGCFLRYLTFAGQMAVLVYAFAPDSDWPILVAGAGLMYYFKYLIPSLTLLDVGIREGAAVLVFGWLGVSEAAALNAALMVFMFNITLPAAVGALFLRRPPPSFDEEAARVDVPGVETSGDTLRDSSST
ncbi:lysylphosphatidylglycerol synthase transmembrane domain-containing protein [Longibacter sp.]|uniref:lysylphosphatidylglycerol synthase transmembrane domain-containing protein n=1 Tax=Longibacter sp. TaxID=2045415 RepID=UPI003EBF88D8